MSTSLPPLRVYLINAFTSTTPHSGNQAGVVIFPANDPRAADDEYKLKVAKDINYSETAFLVPIGPGRWNLRWFTPEVVSTRPHSPPSRSGVQPRNSFPGGSDDRKWHCADTRR